MARPTAPKRGTKTYAAITRNVASRQSKNRRIHIEIRMTRCPMIVFNACGIAANTRTASHSRRDRLPSPALPGQELPLVRRAADDVRPGQERPCGRAHHHLAVRENVDVEGPAGRPGSSYRRIRCALPDRGEPTLIIRRTIVKRGLIGSALAAALLARRFAPVSRARVATPAGPAPRRPRSGSAPFPLGGKSRAIPVDESSRGTHFSSSEGGPRKPDELGRAPTNGVGAGHHDVADR